ncbi:hypothetical protein BH10ACT7_BH10ACT7_29200 [soil metagenome]
MDRKWSRLITGVGLVGIILIVAVVYFVNSYSG